jgi:hypothetical protein
MKAAKYVGWISDTIASREALLRLGVKGKILHNEEASCYEYCEASEKVLETLLAIYPNFYAAAFTAMDFSGKQLPAEEQKYWAKYGMRSAQWG